MGYLRDIYRPSLALLTDLYQLTMAYAYWKSGTSEHEAVFHLFFRNHPFGGGYSLACGLTAAIDLIQDHAYASDDIDYLRGLTGYDGERLFEPDFLDNLARLRLRCDIDAMPEGTLVFPHEPLVRVRGPLLHAQLLETALLNIVNFETLIATKAARIVQAAGGEPVLEFGLRRAHHVGGGLAASRAAYVGGCAASSNVMAGRVFGIPVRGTHAHSWVMSFDSELEAFETYAEVMPNNCVFLVDTYDTLAGVRHAVDVGRRLRARGHDLAGIRLDSGDLAYLSSAARRILDEAGFTQTAIIASNDLDERIIESLKAQGAAITVWGVGTRLVTGGEQSALGGVYKLGAVRRAGAAWQYRLKLSEQAIKVSNPGIQQVRRYRDESGAVADVIYDEDLGLDAGGAMIDPFDPTRRKKLPVSNLYEDLLVPIFRQGQLVYQPPSIHAARQRAHEQLALLHSGIKRFVNPHRYPVGLDDRLYDLKTRLILQARGLS